MNAMILLYRRFIVKQLAVRNCIFYFMFYYNNIEILCSHVPKNIEIIPSRSLNIHQWRRKCTVIRNDCSILYKIIKRHV